MIAALQLTWVEESCTTLLACFMYHVKKLGFCLFSTVKSDLIYILHFIIDNE